MENTLFYDKKTGWDRMSDAEQAAMMEYAEGYKAFLDEAKTERDAVRRLQAMAEANGFAAYTRGKEIHPGEKYYKINRNKAIILFVVGSDGMHSGINLSAAHLDAPRIDIRTVPLYEDNGMALFKTHYYGGIKKYQWTTIPMELRGVVCHMTENGVESVDVRIGDKPGDPVFVITDLLIHLATEQMGKTMMKGIEAENMNVLVGSKPSKSDIETSDKIKLWVMEFLNKEYGITEEDFLSAELTCVPAFKASDVGFDRSFIGAYGHDDRVCSYPAATALLDLKETPKKTSMVILVDKEEIGSDGVTGMQSAAFDTFMEDLCEAQGAALRVCLENSFCLSADVTAAYDPNFGEVFEKKNAAYLNYGIGLCKYTGARGKSGASDASAETVGYVRGIFDRAKVIWQIAELGKVDAGGGGTVAMYMANRNITTLDAGVPVLAMHAPFEVVSKLDCYETYKGMKAVYEAE